MAAYQPFTVSRTTEPDPASLRAQLRAADPTIGVQHTINTPTYVLKKATPWTTPQINAAQNVINTVPAVTPQSLAQAEIDNIPIATLALALMLLDEINVLRAELNIVRAKLSPPLTPPLPDRNEQQAKNAWRTKAGTL